MNTVDERDDATMSFNEAIAVALIAYGNVDATNYLYWSRRVRNTLAHRARVKDFDRQLDFDFVDTVMMRIRITDNSVMWK